MTLLSIVQDACDDIGFPTPATVVGNAEAKQYLRLANREGNALARHDWQALKKEHTFTLVTADQDYALPTDFKYIIPSSAWNRDNQRSLIEPLTSEEWQFFKGWSTVNGLNQRARIRNDLFEFEQTITSGENGQTIAYEYISKNWCESSGGTGQTKFLADSDVAILDEELITLGLIWRFKKAKGLSFEADFFEYDRLVKEAKSRDGGARRVNLDRNIKHHLGVNTQEGSYPSG